MKKVYSIFVCLCMLAGFVACDKDNDFALTTLTVTNETVTPSYETAEVSCSFKADATISEAYVQYSLSSSFADYEVAKMTEEKGRYTALLTGLVDNTTYYIRYTVSNKFSNVVADAVEEFQTLSCTVPTIVLDSIGGVRESHAKAYLHLSFDGGASVTDMGICWSIEASPTIEDIHKSTKDTAAVLDITNLQENTKYYVRAYAVNRVGTAYSEEQVFTTESVFSEPTGTENGYGYVDLGLSVKWATMNVGASSPEEYGNYYAWGETTAKNTYTWNTYKYCNGSETTLTKYNTSTMAGTVDNKTTLELSDDAAYINWDGNWRMPSEAEWEELREQCTWIWTTKNGIKGHKVTSKINDNNIFLPASGRRFVDALTGVGMDGNYWSNTLNVASPCEAMYVLFISNGASSFGSDRYVGHSVRPVLGEKVVESTAPIVATTVVTQITATTAIAGGNVTGDGGASVTERGVVYSTNPNPVITNLSNTIRPCGSGMGEFTYTITGLQPSTKYYVRAYAKNDAGTAYGEEVSFTTNEEMVDNPPSNLVAMPFSVSAGKQVTFSQGNLQYTQSTDTWSFASTQWEMIGTDNVTGGGVTSDPTKGDKKFGDALADKIDLFGWSTSATNFGVSTSISYSDYSGSFVDWGSNQIGADAPNTWRTLTYDEWYYLRYNRTNANDLVGVAQVNGVNGLIFLPDNWTCPSGVTFKSGFHNNDGVDYYAAYQTFSAEQWSKLEAAGAVFLPAAAGNRIGSSVFDVQCRCNYWSATEYNSDYAYYLHFYSSGAGMTNLSRHYGRSVRLVKDL